MQELQQPMQSLLDFGDPQGCHKHGVKGTLHLQDHSYEQPRRADTATLGLWNWQVLSDLSASGQNYTS